MSVPLRKIGKYEIKGQLGIGRTGIVYKGWDPVISREVAIKWFNKNSFLASERNRLLDYLRQKAQAVGRLVHPRIVQIHDFIEDDHSAYIITELVNGKTLEQHLEARQKFGLWEIGQFISQTLDGIGYAHAQGVVHREMKTANIMINNDGRIKIKNFGVRFAPANLGSIGELMGTQAYMSPEQFAGMDVDERTDLYSIGVIAYELLTDKRPFSGSDAAIKQQAMYETPDKPSSLNTQLAPEIDAVLNKAMAKNRDDRYLTAGDFSDAFKRAVSVSLGQVERRSTASLPDAAKLLDATRLLNKDMLEESGTGVPVRMDEDSSIVINTGVRQARLLIVDDDERILTALKSVFRQRYHVFTTTDGNKALDFITRYHMHVIISDQRMPIMTGVELLRRSRAITPRSVRILLTGYSDLAAMIGSINEGEVYRFLSKPWDNQGLQALVGEAATIGLELADTQSQSAVLPEKMKAGVLVIDQDREVFRVIRELIGKLCPTYYASDADEALSILMNKHEVAAVIADVESDREQLPTMLKLLKQKYPQILSIVATNDKDAAQVIDLINQAQVFRILHKPINVTTLKAQVHAALERYLTYEETPELVKAHKVEVPDSMRMSNFAMNVFKNLQSLRTQ